MALHSPQRSSDPPGTLRHSLRTATRSDHAEVDRLIARLDLSRSEDYGHLLSIHHAVLQNLKGQWRREDCNDFAAMSRRLQNDLRVLGCPAGNPQSMPRIPLAEGDRLGIAYVIRGSRLGSSILRPRIASRFSTSYFDFIPTLSWVQFLAQLQSVSPDQDAGSRNAAIRGAKMTFGMFSRLLTQAPI